jgi:Protein of unknown function, DUF547
MMLRTFRIAFATLMLLAAAVVNAAGAADNFNALLGKYVKGDYFDYAALSRSSEDKQRLNDFMTWQGNAKLDGLSREDQIAFYINAYNSANITAVIDHYPVHSPMDIPGYFDKLKFKVAGEELTISEIEYDRLIGKYKDMRAHFTVVCADRGCLPLRGVAYNGKTLSADLETICKQFVNDERQFKIDYAKKEVWISKLFEWYGEKFTKDPVRPAAKPELFLLPYVDDKARALLKSGDYTLHIIEWNWTLNEKLKS